MAADKQAAGAEAAAEAAQGSAGLRTLLHLARDAGNVLNAGTARGAAVGVDLASVLSALEGTRAVAGDKQTALDFVVGHMARHAADALAALVLELAVVAAGMRTAGDAIEAPLALVRPARTRRRP